jgi:hypothetical protein
MSTIPRDYTDNLDFAAPAVTRIGNSDKVMKNPCFVMGNFSIPQKAEQG